MRELSDMIARDSVFEILLAEDNPADVKLVQHALTEHQIGCTLHVTKDGVEAIGFLNALDASPNSQRLDLLLLDMHLPKKGGAEILQRLRSTERYAQTPVIVMTGANFEYAEHQALKHAAVSYFRKPSKLDDFMNLGSIVQNVLQSSPGKRRAPEGITNSG